MEREIKFRAWIPKMESMLEGVTVYEAMIGLNDDDFYSYLPEEGEYFYDDYSCSVKRNDGERSPETMFSPLMGEDWVWIEKEHYELMQYTGLKDSKGVEIYEGDTSDSSKGLVKVGWNRMQYRWSVYSIEKDDIVWNLDGGEEFEVNGNIYENTDLLQ